MNTIALVPAALAVGLQVIAYRRNWGRRARLAAVAVPMAAAAAIVCA